jgi:hypothetical protein
VSDVPDVDGLADALRQLQDGLVGIAVGIARMGEAVGQAVRERLTAETMFVVGGALFLNLVLSRTVVIALGIFGVIFFAAIVWWVATDE